MGQFGGDQNIVPDSVSFENLADRSFASAVDVGSVIVVHTGIVSGHDFFFRLFNVDRVSFFRKPHTAESQD